MSIAKMLLDVVNDMRSFADSVEVLAQAIADGDNRKRVTKSLESNNAVSYTEGKKEKADEKNNADEDTKNEDIKKLNNAITRLELRSIAGKLTRSGKKKEVKALLDSFGVKQLPDLPEEKFIDFYKGLKELEEKEEN